MSTFAGFRRCTTRQGVPLLWRPDPRFKTFRIEFHARRPLDDRAAARSVLPSLLLQGTRTEPDRPALGRRMERLFGASVLPASYKRGASHTLQMSLDAVSGEFLPGRPDQFGDGLAFLAEQLTEPRLDGSGNAFPAEPFAIEQREAIDSVRALQDDKGSWAQIRAVRFVCDGESIAIPEYGSLEALEALTPKDPEDARRDFLAHGQLHMLATGALPEEAALLEAVEEFLGDLPAREAETVAAPAVVARRPTRHQTEHADGMQQAKLVMIFRMAGEPGDAADMTRRVFDTIYGGGPQSRLFKEVREKNSLAYYAQSGFDRHNRLLFVQVGCDAEVAGNVEEACVTELERLAKGDLEDQDLATAQAQIGSRLTRVDESLAARANFTNEYWYLGRDRTPEQLAEELATVDKDAVVAAANEAWLDGVYLLCSDPARSSAFNSPRNSASGDTAREGERA